MRSFEEVSTPNSNADGSTTYRCVLNTSSVTSGSTTNTRILSDLNSVGVLQSLQTDVSAATSETVIKATSSTTIISAAKDDRQRMKSAALERTIHTFVMNRLFHIDLRWNDFCSCNTELHLTILRIHFINYSRQGQTSCGGIRELLHGQAEELFPQIEIRRW